MKITCVNKILNSDCVRHPIVIDEPNARLRRLNGRSSDPTKDGGLY